MRDQPRLPSLGLALLLLSAPFAGCLSVGSSDAGPSPSATPDDLDAGNVSTVTRSYSGTWEIVVSAAEDHPQRHRTYAFERSGDASFDLGGNDQEIQQIRWSFTWDDLDGLVRWSFSIGHCPADREDNATNCGFQPWQDGASPVVIVNPDDGSDGTWGAGPGTWWPMIRAPTDAPYPGAGAQAHRRVTWNATVELVPSG